MNRRRLLLVLFAIAFISWAPTMRIFPQGGFVWTEASFKDFADGTFGDAGANMYVSARGRVQTINRWDLNGRLLGPSFQQQPPARRTA